jgi:hypothetical protein
MTQFLQEYFEMALEGSTHMPLCCFHYVDEKFTIFVKLKACMS